MRPILKWADLVKVGGCSGEDGTRRYSGKRKRRTRFSGSQTLPSSNRPDDTVFRGNGLVDCNALVPSRYG